MTAVRRSGIVKKEDEFIRKELVNGRKREFDSVAYGIWGGIYYVEGDQFAIQILITRELSGEENYWLHSLRNDLRAGGEIKDFIERYDRNRLSGLHQAVADVVLRANWREVEKEKRMCEALRELFKDDFEEARRKGTEAGLLEGRKVGLQEGRQEGCQEGRQ